MENKEKVMNFEDLANIGSVSKTLRIGNREIKIKTLSTEAQGIVMDSIPTEGSDSKKMDILQRMIIASSIESIDGECLTHDEKVALLNRSQAQLTSLIFSEYEKMLEEQNKVFDDVKKNIFLVKKTL